MPNMHQTKTDGARKLKPIFDNLSTLISRERRGLTDFR